MPTITVQDCKDNHIQITYENPINIGHGSFGTVSKAQLIHPKFEVIAIKKVLQDKRFKNRELSIMKSINHNNITKLYYYNYESDSTSNNNNNLYLNLLMEFLPTTLYKRNQSFTLQNKFMPLNEVKIYIYQSLKALDYLHDQNICHRDIKPQNILINHHPEDDYLKFAKICDFGSAKKLSSNEQNVSYICSRYYRAPELIFGSTNYTTKIDIWSIGCVFAELLIGQPLFPGESGIDQLVEIIKILGTPTNDDIISMNNNYTNHKFPIIKKISFIKIFKNLNSNIDQHVRILNFLEKFLLFNPNKRISAKDALKDEWFRDLK